MRRVFVIWLAMAGVCLVAPTAQAGASSLEVTSVDGDPSAAGRSWAQSGASLTMRSTFGRGAYPVSAGPWFAYLDRDHGADLLLGRAAVRSIEGTNLAVARVTFVVPGVPRGVYRVAVCDRGCHHGVGDLDGGILTVAATATEARLVASLHRLESRLPALREQARRGATDRERLAEAIAARDAARASLDSLEAANQRLTSQRDVALDGRDAAEAEVRALDREARNWRYAAYILAVITAATWTIAAVRRRDTVRIRIPDTIEELDEADDRADR